MKARDFWFTLIITIFGFIIFALVVIEEIGIEESGGIDTLIDRANRNWDENFTCKDLAEWIVGNSMKNAFGIDYEVLAIDKIVQIDEIDDEKLRCKAVALTSQGRTNVIFNHFEFSGEDYWEIWETW